MVICNSRWIEYIMKMKLIKCYNDTHYSHPKIKQQAHFKNILHVPTSAAVMKTARQTAILHLYNMPQAHYQQCNIDQKRHNWYCQKGSTEQQSLTAKLAALTLLSMWTTYCHKKAVGRDALWQLLVTMLYRLLLHNIGALTGVQHHDHDLTKHNT